jgi:hypothetical protein
MMHRSKGFLPFAFRALFIGVLLIIAELTTGGLRREAAGLRAKIEGDQRRIEEGDEALTEDAFSTEISAIADGYFDSFIEVPDGSSRSTIIHDRLQKIALEHHITLEHSEEHASYQQIEISRGLSAVVTTHQGSALGDFEHVAEWLNAVQAANPGFGLVAFSIQPAGGEFRTSHVRVEFTINAGSLCGARPLGLTSQPEDGA